MPLAPPPRGFADCRRPGSHHILPLLREITEPSVRLSAAAFIATLVLAVCGPLYAGPDRQLLPSTAHAQSKPRTSQGQPAQKNLAEQVRSAVDTLIARLRGRTLGMGRPFRQNRLSSHRCGLCRRPGKSKRNVGGQNVAIKGTTPGIQIGTGCAIASSPSRYVLPRNVKVGRSGSLTAPVRGTAATSACA